MSVYPTSDARSRTLRGDLADIWMQIVGAVRWMIRSGEKPLAPGMVLMLGLGATAAATVLLCYGALTDPLGTTAVDYGLAVIFAIAGVVQLLAFLMALARVLTRFNYVMRHPRPAPRHYHSIPHDIPSQGGGPAL